MSAAFCTAWINELSLALPVDWTRDVPDENVDRDVVYFSTSWSSPYSTVTLTATVASTGETSADIGCSRWSIEAENLTASALATAIDAVTRYGAQPDLPDMTAAFVGIALTYHDWLNTEYQRHPVEMRRWTSPDGYRTFDFLRRDQPGNSIFIIRRINPGTPEVEAAITADGATPTAVLLSLAMSD